MNLLFLSGNSVCWVTPFRASSDGRPNRIIFRGGPYGADNDYAKLRERLPRRREFGPALLGLVGAFWIARRRTALIEERRHA